MNSGAGRARFTKTSSVANPIDALALRPREGSRAVIMVIVVIIACAFVLGGAQAAESWPVRNVQVVVPYTPGTGADILARTLGPKLAERLKVGVITDNRAGATGNIGTDFVAKAAPDGYTLLCTATSFGTNPALNPKLPFDPVKSFAPVALLATSALAVIVTPQLPAKSMREFVDYARRQPGKLYYSSPGNGGPQHLAMELLKLEADIDLVHVPYKGSGGALTDLVGGHVQAMIVSLQTAAPYVHGGKLRMLAVMSAARSPAFPEVPTLKEQGLPDIEVDTWYGLFAPAGTPAEIVAKLNAEMNALLRQPEVRELLAKARHGRRRRAPPSGSGNWCGRSSRAGRAWSRPPASGRTEPCKYNLQSPAQRKHPMSLIEDVAAAYRILAEHGVIDAYGHVSARSDRDPGRYFLSRSLAPELVNEEDIMEYDLDSNPVDPRGRESVRERFIHGEIYKARPEVMAVVHNHSPSVIPFGVTAHALRPIFHMSAFVGEGVPTFEIRDAEKGTDLLVKTPYLGQALAKCLGKCPAALMRGHGAVVVGENLPRAVGRSIYLELSAKLQAQAMALAGPAGQITYLDDREVKASVPVQDYMRAWPMWRSKALAQMRSKSLRRLAPMLIFPPPFAFSPFPPRLLCSSSPPLSSPLPCRVPPNGFKPFETNPLGKWGPGGAGVCFVLFSVDFGGGVSGGI